MRIKRCYWCEQIQKARKLGYTISPVDRYINPYHRVLEGVCLYIRDYCVGYFPKYILLRAYLSVRGKAQQ